MLSKWLCVNLLLPFCHTNNGCGYLFVVQLRSTHSITSYSDEAVELKNKVVGVEYFEIAPNIRNGRTLIVDGLEEPTASCFTPN
jgi:hypothetical protein